MKTVFKFAIYAVLFVIVVLFVNSLFMGNTRNAAPNENISRLGSDTESYKVSANETPSVWDKTKEKTSDAADAVADKSSDAWEATKEGTAKAWDKTKEGTSDAAGAIADKSGDAWEATKKGTAKVWDKTKNAVDAD